jgi:hypothetical protein
LAQLRGPWRRARFDPIVITRGPRRLGGRRLRWIGFRRIELGLDQRDRLIERDLLTRDVAFGHPRMKLSEVRQHRFARPVVNRPTHVG